MNYQPYIFTDRYISDGYYQIQVADIGVRIYDFYAEYYTANMSEIRLYSEMWGIQRWRQQGPGGSWLDVGAATGNPTFTIEASSIGVNITRSFSNIGVFNVTYVFSEGVGLKHLVTYQNTLFGETTFRVEQIWSGIVGDRVQHNHQITPINTQTVIDSPYFIFRGENNALTVLEDQGSMYYGYNETSGDLYRKLNQTLQPTLIEPVANGMKATYIFSNWTLPSNGVLTIDPTTATIQPADADTYISLLGPTSNYGSQPNAIIGDNNVVSSEAKRGLIKFPLSSISQAAIVSNATLEIYESSESDPDGVGDMNVTVNRLLQDWVELEATWNIYSTGNSWGTAGADGAGDIDSDISAYLVLDGTACGCFVMWSGATLIDDVQKIVDGTYANNYGWRLKSDKESQGTNRRYGTFSSSDNAVPANRPKFTVTYTLAGFFDDYVDRNTSNVDGSSDVGSHSSFSDEQSAPDSTYDTLTEADNSSETAGTQIFLSFGSSESAVSAGGVGPCTVSGNAIGPPDASYNTCAKDDNAYEVDYNTTGLAGKDILQVYANITYYGTVSGTLYWAYNTTSAGLTFTSMGNLDEGGSAGSPLTASFNLTSIRASWKIGDINNTEIQFYNDDAGGSEDAFVDSMYLTVVTAIYSQVLDLEEQFTNVDTSWNTATLAIYMGTVDAEDILVDIWYSSAWTNLFTDLAAGWNNATVTTYLNATMTIRFRDGTKSSDTNTGSWQKDAAFLHLENVTGNTYSLTVVHTISISHSVSRVLGASRESDHIVAASDTGIRTLILQRSIEMSAAINHVVDAVKGVIRSIVYTISGTHSVDRILAATRSATSTVPITHSSPRVLSATREVDHTISILDTVEAIQGVIRSAVHQITISFTGDRDLGATRTASNPITISHSGSRVLSAARAVENSAAVNFTAEFIRGLIRAIQNSISVQQETGRTFSANRESDNTVTISHSGTRTLSVTRSASSLVSISSTVDFVRGLIRSASNLVSVNHSVDRTLQAVRTTGSAVTVSTQNNRVLDAVRSVQDIIQIVWDNIVDVVTGGGGATYSLTLNVYDIDGDALPTFATAYIRLENSTGNYLKAVSGGTVTFTGQTPSSTVTILGQDIGIWLPVNGSIPSTTISMTGDITRTLLLGLYKQPWDESYVYLAGENLTITSTPIDVLHPKMNFVASGTCNPCIVYSGSFLDKPTRLDIDGAQTAEDQGWTWDTASKLTYVWKGSNIYVVWGSGSSGQPGGGGGGGGGFEQLPPPPPEGQTTTTQPSGPPAATVPPVLPFLVPLFLIIVGVVVLQQRRERRKPHFREGRQKPIQWKRRREPRLRGRLRWPKPKSAGVSWKQPSRKETKWRKRSQPLIQFERPKWPESKDKKATWKKPKEKKLKWKRRKT